MKLELCCQNNYRHKTTNFSKFALQYINPEILKLRFVVFGLALHGSFLHALKKIVECKPQFYGK